jgi:formylglycine-generating enzyme required for sulfatase activity
MADHNRIGRRTSVLAVTFAIGACTLAISAWALEPVEDGSAVAYSANDLGMQFVSVPAGQFPMGCSEGAKPVESQELSKLERR